MADPAASQSPRTWWAEAADLRARKPRHLLFLCVANSARSQMAEGIARHLASGPVVISSAGSEPTSVRSEAVRVLAEIGIDISGQRSKGVDEIASLSGAGTDDPDVEGDLPPVDTVITLCAEAVCPVWLGDAHRLHWGLPDPAAVTGAERERLDAFRGVRDELLKRLRVVLS